jgi:hypothetical protein
MCECLNNDGLSVISGFRRDVGDICGLLGYYAASSGNPLPMFRDKDFLTLDDGTDRLSRNVGIGLPLDSAQYRTTAQISTMV